MDNNDWDLFAIVRSCKASTSTPRDTISENPPPPSTLTTTNTLTNNTISHQNVTPSYFDNFTFTHRNSLTSFATTTIPIPSSTIPTIITNTTSSPTTTIPTLSTTTIPAKITTTIPTINPNTFIPIPTANIHTFNITSPVNNNITITPIYTTNTFTTPTPTTTICTHTTTTAPPTMNNTNISVQGTNQYRTISDFTIPIKQQIQPNNNQVFFPKHVTHIEITSVHFDRAYNQPLVPQQPLRESNQLPLVPQINSQVLSNTHPQEPQHKSRKRKNNNQMQLEDHVIEEKAIEDSWTWKKYGQKPISGTPHPRSYYKCNSSRDCPARKLVQKSKTKENTYVVTYKRDHNHKKPAGNLKPIIGTSWNKSSETRLPSTGVAGSSPNAGNFHLPNVAVLQFDQPESSNTQVSNLGSPNVMMLQFDELESNTGSLDDDDDAILIEKMKTILENFLVEFNQLRALFP